MTVASILKESFILVTFPKNKMLSFTLKVFAVAILNSNAVTSSIVIGMLLLLVLWIIWILPGVTGSLAIKSTPLTPKAFLEIAATSM